MHVQRMAPGAIVLQHVGPLVFKAIERASRDGAEHGPHPCQRVFHPLNVMTRGAVVLDAIEHAIEFQRKCQRRVFHGEFTRGTHTVFLHELAHTTQAFDAQFAFFQRVLVVVRIAAGVHIHDAGGFRATRRDLAIGVVVVVVVGTTTDDSHARLLRLFGRLATVVLICRRRRRRRRQQRHHRRRT